MKLDLIALIDLSDVTMLRRSLRLASRAARLYLTPTTTSIVHSNGPRRLHVSRPCRANSPSREVSILDILQQHAGPSSSRDVDVGPERRREMRGETVELDFDPPPLTPALVPPSDEEVLSEMRGEEVPSKTLIEHELTQLGVDWEPAEHTGSILADCPCCLTEKSSHISTVNGTVTCIACHDTGPFQEYTKRVTLSKKEDTCENQIVRFEDRRIEETLKRMEDDDDLYDRVGYLDLTQQYEETRARKKMEQIEQIRRLQDGADSLSPRALDDSAIPSLPPVVGAAPLMIDPEVKRLWLESAEVVDLAGVDYEYIRQLRVMLGVERISTETLRKYYVRAHIDSYDQPAILYPRYRNPASRTRPPPGLKVIRKVGDELVKENYPGVEVAGKPVFSGIFGAHMTTASDRKVIVTTNERDALAVYDCTGMLTYALPMGERMDQQVIPYLEQFDQIFLWFPHRHLEYAKDLAMVLNPGRCYLVRSVERPIEIVRSTNPMRDPKREVNHILREDTVRVRDKGFRSMVDVRQELRSELINSTSRIKGLAQWKRFPALNTYLLGFRPGELTVLTGGTGVGKTTFLCEYSLDLFTQGVRTLFCSFEMPEEKILKWMLVQFAGKPLQQVEFHNSIELWLDRFERTKSLTVMKKDEFADKTVREIFEAIRAQVTNSGIQHVVIDNLQFLVGMNDEGTSSMLDKFAMQDAFVGYMRRLATEYGVHVTLVVHLRKIDPDTDLDMQHIGGTARVSQEADNVLAMQIKRDPIRKRDRKFLYILKNRYGGQRVNTDVLELVFQPHVYSHVLKDHIHGSRND